MICLLHFVELIRINLKGIELDIMIELDIIIWYFSFAFTVVVE